MLIRLLERRYQEQIRCLQDEFQKDRDSLGSQTCQLRSKIKGELTKLNDQLIVIIAAIDSVYGQSNAMKTRKLVNDKNQPTDKVHYMKRLALQVNRISEDNVRGRK